MDPLDLDQDIAEHKQRKQKRKEEGNLESLEGDLDTELLLLSRPKKTRPTTQFSSRARDREYVHNTSVRTISKNVPTKESTKKRVPRARKNLLVSRPVDTDVPGMCVVPLVYCIA